MPRRVVLGALLLTACGADRVRMPNTPPPSVDDLQATVPATLDRVLGARYPLDAPSVYRFAEPVPGRVASWHWEPQQEGHVHTLGYRHGWCVDFWFTPSYAGYPAQPEVLRMAFVADGKLRGIFAAGSGNAPVELDKWSPDWVDSTWSSPASAPGR
jgi:hypothetical protein